MKLKKSLRALRTSLKKILSLHGNHLDKTQMIKILSNNELTEFNVVEFFEKSVINLLIQINVNERLIKALEIVVKIGNFVNFLKLK